MEQSAPVTLTAAGCCCFCGLAWLGLAWLYAAWFIKKRLTARQRDCATVRNE